MDDNIQTTATRLVRRLKGGGHKITVAESCTGGLLASTLTDIAGASSWFTQSWVTYANEAKISELDVLPETLEAKGAVSAKVAIEMAQGALKRADADFAISVTGIAGPTNEGSTKPIDTVYVGIASRTWATAKQTQIGGTRAENKFGFVHFALITAIGSFDKAMVDAEEARNQKIEALETAKRQEKEREEERERRDEEARESAPWQDEAWSASDSNDGSGLDLEVEWVDGEE